MKTIKGDFSDLVGIGGAACLDFANTISGRGTAAEFDRLENYRDLPVWACAARLISKLEARQLEETAARAPRQAEDCFAHATALREALYRVGVRATNGARAPSDVAELSRLLFPLIATSGFEAEASGRLRLAPLGSHMTLYQPLWLVAWSGFELFTGDEQERLRQCENDGCTWLFLDRSKNLSRRWCSMNLCGAIVKARQYRARRRAR